MKAKRKEAPTAPSLIPFSVGQTVAEVIKVGGEPPMMRMAPLVDEVPDFVSTDRGHWYNKLTGECVNLVVGDAVDLYQAIHTPGYCTSVTAGSG